MASQAKKDLHNKPIDPFVSEQLVSALRISNKRVAMYLSSHAAAEEVVMDHELNPPPDSSCLTLMYINEFG